LVPFQPWANGPTSSLRNAKLSPACCLLLAHGYPCLSTLYRLRLPAPVVEIYNSSLLVSTMFLNPKRRLGWGFLLVTFSPFFLFSFQVDDFDDQNEANLRVPWPRIPFLLLPFVMRGLNVNCSMSSSGFVFLLSSHLPLVPRTHFQLPKLPTPLQRTTSSFYSFFPVSPVPLYAYFIFYLIKDQKKEFYTMKLASFICR
jgi:hypothetical protein